MAVFCTKCGAQLKEGASFCTECGAPASAPAAVQAAPASPAQTAQSSAPAASTAPAYVQSYVPVSAAAAAPAVEEKVGLGYFFGMMLLYAIPIIGTVLCIVMCFAAGSATKRNFARATMIWILIGLLLVFALVRLVKRAVNVFKAYFKEELDGLGDLGSLSELGGLDDVGKLEGYDFSGLDENADIDDILGMIQNGQLGSLLG